MIGSGARFLTPYASQVLLSWTQPKHESSWQKDEQQFLPETARA
jgi:hypothetical protein